MTETKRKTHVAGGRAESLREVLYPFYDCETDLSQIITDTLTDLRHLCEHKKIDFDRCNAKGQDLYHDERAEDIANGRR